MGKTVAIDCFHERLAGADARAVVAVDVIRAATTAVTAAATGRHCFPVPSLEVAMSLAARLEDPLLAGELGGSKPAGFELANSPAQVERRRDDLHRPLVLLSSSGTRLMWETAVHEIAYAACLRNHSAQAAELVSRHEDVLLVGAGSRGEFREEDQLCCARIGAALVAAGYEVRDSLTKRVIDRWSAAAPDSFLGAPSSEFLRATGQEDDLEFILDHVDDLDLVFPLERGEVLKRRRP